MNSGSNMVNSAIVQVGNKNMRTLQHPSTGNTSKLNNNNQNLNASKSSKSRLSSKRGGGSRGKPP